MSAKDCGHHHEHRAKLNHRIFYGICILILIVLLLLTIFIVWATLRPTKPRFLLQDATVYLFNASTSPPYTLSTNMQITISSRNKMDRVGIYYQKLDVFATYRGQQVTPPFLLPTTYQGHKEISAWSPFLSGSDVPVSPGLAAALQQDRNVGSVLLNIKIDGSLKWKVGTWFSGRYHLHVNCPASIRFCDKNTALRLGEVMKFELVQGCMVDV